MDNPSVFLSAADSFAFSCTKKVPCFNDCCRDLNQFLTPYDILRLKHHIGLPSRIFLERFTSVHTGPESGLPVVCLTAKPVSSLKCPFLSPDGCSVYEARPSSCRMYPLARIASRSRKTDRINEKYMLIKEPHCKGFFQGAPWTVREWIQHQGITPYNEMNDLLMEILSLKNRLRPGPLDALSRHLFYTACYDLDTFGSQLREKTVGKDSYLDSHTSDAVIEDDVLLLKLGLNWIKQTLFCKDPAHAALSLIEPSPTKDHSRTGSLPGDNT